MSFLQEELSQRVNRLRDDQARANLVFEHRLQTLEAENVELHNRLTVLTRLLIARQIASAEEIAASLAASASVPNEVSTAQ